MFITGIPALVVGFLSFGDINKSGGKVGGKPLAIIGMVLGVIGCLATLILIPFGLSIREAARITVAQNNMRQMAVAAHNYESAFMRFPAAVSEPDREVLLSWRVQILPFIDHQALHEKFNQEEPWDSPHNKALLDQMPDIYKSISHSNIPSGNTIYLAPVTIHPEDGYTPEMALFHSKGPTSVGQISDGTSHTIMYLEVDPEASVPWTKPDEWVFDPKNPKRSVGKARGSCILVAMADGSVQTIPANIDPKDFKALITRAGGEGFKLGAPKR